MRIMRSNYDKPMRCPAWSGPAMKLSKIGVHHPNYCKSGMLTLAWMYERWPQWRFHQCPRCQVIVLPFAWRKFSVLWWINHWKFKWRYR